MKFKYSVLISFFLSISACGGGGSGGSGSVSSPAPNVTITTTNGTQVAADAGSGDSITSGATAGISPLSVSQPTQNAIKLTELTQQLLHLGHDQQLQVQTVTTCSGGGTVMTPDNPSATSGTVTFSNCGFLPGLTIDGSMTFSKSGDKNNYSASVSYSNFTITNGVTVSTVNASMTITGSYTAPVETVSVSIPNFDLTVNSDYIRLYNFSSTGTTNSTTSEYTLSWDYTYDSSFINGAVHVATEQQLQGYSYNSYPNTGSVVVTGVNNSHVAQPMDLARIPIW